MRHKLIDSNAARRSTRSGVAIVALALTVALFAGCSTNAGGDGDAASSGNDKTMNPPADAAITASVKARLAADPQVNPFEIDVDTQESVVRLSGYVEDREDIDAAVRVAESVDGVREVENELKEGDPSTGEVVRDQWIETKVKSKLTADPEVNPFNVDVDVIDGVVTLTGRVDDDKTREEAGLLAESTYGVVKVENRLKLGTPDA